MRTGLIARKLGMTTLFVDDGVETPVTLLHVEHCQVISQRTHERDGYTAVQLGSGSRKVKNVGKPQRGHFAKSKVEPKAQLKEFRVSDDALVEVGAELLPSHFMPGQFVDVRGNTKGCGFSGGMKRWNFGGMEATHGVSISHRAHGSTGQCQDPGKVFKGKKMAGQYGNEQVTVQNLEIVQVDDEKGLIAVRGAVPGKKNGWLFVTDAIKRGQPANAPFPAAIKIAQQEKVEEAKSEEAPAAESAPEASTSDKEVKE